jgi:hypothetical protein
MSKLAEIAGYKEDVAYYKVNSPLGHLSHFY